MLERMRGAVALVAASSWPEPSPPRQRAGMGGPGRRPRRPPSAVGGISPAVILHGRDARTIVVHVELASTEADRARGLMYRNHLEPDAGMLFLFPEPSPLAFWMKNTLIPLDMLFLDQDRRVLGIVENADARDGDTPAGGGALPVRAGDRRRTQPTVGCRAGQHGGVSRVAGRPAPSVTAAMRPTGTAVRPSAIVCSRVRAAGRPAGK